MIQEEADRRQRLDEIRNDGVNPYPQSGNRTHQAQEFCADYLNLLSSQEEVIIVGRILAIRKHGGVTFLVVSDEGGSLQVALKKDELGDEIYSKFLSTFDVGDFIEVTGQAYETKTKEPTVIARSFKMLTKALLPLPEKWHGLSDTEIRYRKRYLDLAINPEERQIFHARANIIQALRQELLKQNYLEVETPILQPIAGGAEARPFVTYHNSLDSDFYLRIAPELYLKRCLVGGFEKVFEVARCFRNEGISFQHNPEFTQIECYTAYMNFSELVDHLEGLIIACVKAVKDSTDIENDSEVLSFSAPFERKEFYDLVKEATDIDLGVENSEDRLRKAMEKFGIKTDGILGFGALADELWKKKVRPNIIQPTFVMGYPAAMKPLAKRRDDDLQKSSNVQLVIKGLEVINAFAELNDPLEQEDRFKEQESLRQLGSEEAHSIDQDYLEALKVGMPPAFGYGIGIDRLTALLLNKHSIKEVIIFPTLKPIQEDEE